MASESIDFSIRPWFDGELGIKKQVGKVKEIAGRAANSVIVAMFKYTTYKTNSDETPWCAACVNSFLNTNGYKGTNSAAAISFAKYGIELAYAIPGCVLVMRHPSGGNHVTFFSKWIDESKHIAECIGGNQSNSIKASIFNLSGNRAGHDQVVAYKWPVKND
jgi:uncharacterized protein (TIGR02594 family)